MPSLSLIASILAVGSLIQTASATLCPPLGPVLPAPRSPSKNYIVKAAAEGLKAQLDGMLQSSINASAVSVGVKSIHESVDLLNYHFTPPVKADVGTDVVDENTIYRVGSVSKLLPALLVQQLDIDLDASVLKFLPELDDGNTDDMINVIQWKDITVRSLMSHLSGVARHLSSDLTAVTGYPWTEKGLPKLGEGEGLKCGQFTSQQRPCELADLLDILKTRSAVTLPYATPAYSNLGYDILGLVLEAATGEKFPDLAKKHVFDVLGMDSTSFLGPVASFETHGFVPVTESTWNITLGVDEPSGGMFSSTKDMLALMEGIASNTLLSPARTRSWMKPQSHTASLGFSVGGPWEIFRSEKITSDKRAVDVYAKSGGIGLYSIYVGIVPDYDIVFSITMSGPDLTLNPFALPQWMSSLISTIVPAIEAAGKAEAARSSVGTFVDKKTNSTLKLELDSGPGLRVASFNVRGYDALSNWASYNTEPAASGGALPTTGLDLRLYPTEKVNVLEDGTTETAWLGLLDLVPAELAEQLESTIFYQKATCVSWNIMDSPRYNMLGIGEFVVTTGADGTVTKISNKAFGVAFTKVSGGSNGPGCKRRSSNS